ncbi:MAG TPA: carboxyl transferase domain-containing protein [Polyangiaceae bacterium]|nr:carboxyl transferase domain-containing protein [Polyangiaceae bacterium]
MTWQREVDELRAREAMAREMGGPEKVARHTAAGKLTVRERIARLVDPGSFVEIGATSGFAEYAPDGSLARLSPANFLFGRGRVEGRTVVVEGDDFTVRGGAADAGLWLKQVAAEQMANELRLPVVRLVDGSGGGGSVKTLDSPTGRTYVPRNPAWEWVVRNLATVPTVGLALGSVAGLGAARVVTSHYSIMVKGMSQLFVAGPRVVARTGERLDKEELGGSHIHARNGSVDDEATSEDEAFDRARRFLGYLPSSVDEVPPRGPREDDASRRDDWLVGAVPRDERKVYKMRPIVEAIVDRGSFLEIGRQWGRSIVTGLARLDGWPVAVMAGDPYFYGGGWGADTSLKVTRFVDLAETFHVPMVHLVDNPGFLVGVRAERAATIRHGAHALAGVYQATIPWCSVIVRKCYGVAGAAHCDASRFHYRYAWPSGDWGSLPIAGGLEAAYKAELDRAEDRAARLAEIERRLQSVRSPFRTAEAFLVEDIIDPRDTRPLLCEFANLAAPLRRPGPARFGMRP